jgi:general secretion pathway protein F
VGFIEPAMILLMGLVIGFIVLSMLAAIFSITDLPF